MIVKLSVSLPDEDVEFLDDYISQGNASSRSAALHHAVDMLRMARLEDAYTSAFAEWDDGDDAALWDSASGDGLADAPR
ncbi:ribbon-helix-helix domain-containing protein [Spongiactinospora gelatinilytica]|uniref:ribbon-helix-helix domain-containing protein n=1 Tax=Spongiactinospora gelatinilytica TaxID=2666298 RepID=UPI0018F362BA|nr:hypothetical protein [Spongiactinospora gelatinilytica]